MKTVLVYPLPFNIWGQYRALVHRFTETFKAFPPGCEYELYATCHWGEPSDYVREWFYGIKTRFLPYYSDGAQIGAQLAVAGTLENAFVIGLTTHTYFHRQGWLSRFMDVVESHKHQGLFGTCGSEESKPHLRTNFFGMTAEDWQVYPYEILSREDCSRFECGEWCLAEWYRHYRNTPPKVVHWDSVNAIEERVANGYRDGNQEQLLVWDRHTREYEEASDDQKLVLSALARGEKIERDKAEAKE